MTLRHALRVLRRTPLLFAAAVLTLALGTGLATGVLAVAYGLLLRPLPYPSPDRLVSITVHQRGDEARAVGLRLDEFDDWRERLHAFESVGGYLAAEATLRGAGEARSVRAAMVTDGFFETLGVSAIEGSTDGIGRGAMTAALSRRLADQIAGDGDWRERGLTIGTNDFRVGAIMPHGFAFPREEVDVWMRGDEMPAVALYSSEDQRRFRLIGRLGRGVTVEQAREDVRRVAREIDAAAEPRRQRDATLRGLHDREREDARATLVPFLLGSALVLLVACANVSGLLAARAVAREPEFAVRRALGASTVQILRGSFVESFTIALGGWAAGLWIAHLVVRLFASLAAGSLPGLLRVRIDAPVAVLSLALAVGVALLSGAVPALRAARTDPNAALKQAAGRIGRRGTAVRDALVIGQIAVTVVLLVSAGLLMRTVERILSEPRGFETAGSVSMRLRLAQNLRFEVDDRAPYVNRLLTEVRALPGVAAAGIGSDLPPNGTQLEMTMRVVEDGREEMFALSPVVVTPGYLEALGASLAGGRLFEDRDRAASIPPLVITETAARLVFKGRDAVGRDWPSPLPGSPRDSPNPLVIGVVRDVRQRGLDGEVPAVLYAPWEVLAPSQAFLVVRTAGSPEALGPSLRRIVRDLDPSLPVYTPRTMEDVVAESIADRRLRLQLAASFAGLALGLAGVALWGAVAQSVIDRRRELAVRLALGASHAAAVRLVVRGGVVLIAIGITIGGATSAAVARLLDHLLHGIGPADPVAFAAAIALAAAISLAACYVPARRAAAISPAELLRDI